MSDFVKSVVAASLRHARRELTSSEASTLKVDVVRQALSKTRDDLLSIGAELSAVAEIDDFLRVIDDLSAGISKPGEV